MIGILFVVFAGICVTLGEYELSDYASHPCMRECGDGAPPMTCVYNFTVEYYYVLTKACYDCPYNITDCYRPHCVAADGVGRGIITTNRMLPGPAIQVCQNDMVVVNVHNKMEGSEGTTIHWHGVFQKGYQHHDGVSMVTQCPITAHSKFQYRFKAGNRGTHFWHGHAGVQRSDGLFGALIIREPPSRDPSSHLYDHDLPEHTMIVHDWLVELTINRFAGHHHAGYDNKPASMLINGRGAFHEFPTSDTNETIYTPYSVFNVRKDQKYRFRVISNGILNCPIQVSVDHHDIIMIATDGVPHHPVVVSSFNIFAGERYDFILDADKAVDNYWIRSRGMADCAVKSAKQLAILRYENATETEPSGPSDYESGRRGGKLLNPWNKKGSPELTPVSWLNTTLADPLHMKQVPDKKFYTAMDFYTIDNYVFHHKDFYPLAAVNMDKRLYLPQMNHISNSQPPSPPLSQFADIPKDSFCGPHNTRNCSQEFCECIHIIKVDLDDTVEMVLIDEGVAFNANHPIHLHGHHFRVVAMDRVNESTSLEEIKQMDADGQIERNLETPIAKDTVTVPDGGYTVIRFHADNPGFWLMHCHIDFHVSIGMGLIVQVGELNQMPRPPKHFPRCGNWEYTGEEEEEEPRCPVSGAGLNEESLWLPALWCIFVVVYSHFYI
ncbi:laccase-2-like isoform X1 [Haliotis rufescens]|uniref:laccase-2-like isoform X1 n=2 Tax=Haliotis rufescens TaxID=6454 RepID=UPI00201F5789|nr:laccase-2-like isoform X1 [Haliotis rufescens]